VENYDYTLGETLLEVIGIDVSYNNVPVLKDVTFNIKDIIRPGLTQGQVECLLAPSGMGKSQLFRVLAGLKKPDKGTVKIDGKPHKGPGDVGVVAQDYPLFKHLTVFENLMLSAKLTYTQEGGALDMVLTYLSQFQLRDKAGCYPHQISGGQRQRIAIIQQMLHCRGLLLMDEPFSGLDPISKKLVQDFIVKIASTDEHLTTIVTTHDIASAVAIADSIMLLGREHTKNGDPIPGANIRFTYNLMDMGLTWHPDVHTLPAFTELVKEINARFYEL
jgi:ABC-type nitrate/sulfonate/bicarbonate transport system ATPase subunit